MTVFTKLLTRLPLDLSILLDRHKTGNSPHAVQARTPRKTGQSSTCAFRSQGLPNRSRHADWIVTLAFYRALHAVDSYLADKCKIHPSNHRDRRMDVQQYLGTIHGEYSALFTASMKARYRKYTYENNLEEVGKLLNLSLKIENHIKKLL